MVVGAHVSASGGMVPALARGDEIGAHCVQIFTQSPRAWKPTQYADEVLASYRDAQEDHPRVASTFCHATYLINLATSDDELYDKSVSCLVANLTVARGIGAAGLVLHVGSHKGRGLDEVLPQISDALHEALEAVPTLHGSDPCPILLENAAGAGGTVGRSFDELAAIMEVTDASDDLGICLDTQHLWASGVAFASLEDADDTMADLHSTIGLERLGCVHLNDSKVDFGANRDRHANLGEGTIGFDGMAALMGHPALDGIPAILEVPGDGKGPRASDVVTAQRMIAVGQERWV